MYFFSFLCIYKNGLPSVKFDRNSFLKKILTLYDQNSPIYNLGGSFWATFEFLKHPNIYVYISRAKHFLHCASRWYLWKILSHMWWTVAYMIPVDTDISQGINQRKASFYCVGPNRVIKPKRQKSRASKTSNIIWSKKFS